LKSNKLSLYLIFGIPLLGILATTAYYFYVTGNGIKMDTINKGILITPPKLITEIPLYNTDGTKHIWYQGENQWTFLVAGRANCDETCLKKMYLVRQIHTAIGKDSLRINMVYLNLDKSLGAETSALFAKDYAHFQILQADGAQMSTWFKHQAPALDIVQAANFYVVDPAGWIMMYYTDAQDYKAVIKDMKFLLSNS
jgi:cytochrome oxidase Cu insertion factor (SCO1/SenC/PrrC family)